MSDRIDLSVTAPASWADALEAHRDLVARETLATSVESVTEGDDDAEPVIHVTVAG